MDKIVIEASQNVEETIDYEEVYMDCTKQMIAAMNLTSESKLEDDFEVVINCNVVGNSSGDVLGDLTYTRRVVGGVVSSDLLYLDHEEIQKALLAESETEPSGGAE